MDATTAPTTVDLIRHGQPLGGDRFRGQLDDPLSEAGWEDMRLALGEATPWGAVISSPLKRCADFARGFAGRCGLALEIEPRFIEIGFGEWEGSTYDEILAGSAERLHAFWADPSSTSPPGGETVAAFQARVLEAWNDLLREHDGGHVLAVVHAGVIRTVVCAVLGIPMDRYYRLEVPKARVTRIRHDDRRGRHGPRVLFHGARL